MSENCICYHRVATPRQATDGSGLQRQQESTARYAAEMGYTVVAALDEVASGTLYTTRSVLQEALTLLESGEAEVLVVESMDRLVQSTEIGSRIRERLKACGARLEFSSPLARGMVRQMEAILRQAMAAE
jgi:DNA invertase Pin-like site-specific DNA recombinase